MGDAAVKRQAVRGDSVHVRLSLMSWGDPGQVTSSSAACISFHAVRVSQPRKQLCSTQRNAEEAHFVNPAL